MGTIYRGVNESQLDLNDLLTLLDSKSTVIEKEDAADYEFKGGAVEYKNVSYGHRDKLTIKDVSFSVEPGSKVAVIGESGIGKSTIFKLLYRLFDPETGDILLDGQNLKDMKLDSFRNAMSIVPQNPALFNDSILYNLTYSRPESTMEEIERVCKMVNVHDMIAELPDGYNSQVGELGNKLSGGEKQRIAIARALLKPAEIYIFDEATSAIDSQNEKLFMDIVDNVLDGKTRIFAAHRLSTITGCDNIVVIGEDGVLEQGTHTDLLAKPNSEYSRLWHQFLHHQQEEEENEHEAQAN